MKTFLFLLVISTPSWAGPQLSKYGISIGDYPTGKRNNIADVAGVKVGHTTLIEETGKHAVRTGVTVVFPVPDDLWVKPVPSAVYTFNGIGEAAGFSMVQESGILQTPIALTNTLSVGDVQKAMGQWVIERHPEEESPIAVVMECDDSSLNDIHRYRVGKEHVEHALRDAKPNFSEGSVGAGTGMVSYDFKSGIGSASRVIDVKPGKKYTVGVLVNSNLGTGTRNSFRFLGIPVGRKIKDLMPHEKPWDKRGAGSLVMVVATDAPMDHRQLERFAKRAFSGVFRTGSPGYNGSGDFVIAFSTANRNPSDAEKLSTTQLCDPCLNDFFEAVSDAAEESILNSMVDNQEMKGRDKNQVYAFPISRILPLKALTEGP